MVKHIVMFKFLESAQGRTKKENAQIAADMLINLQSKVPTLLSSEVKLNSVNADATNYDLILISDFRTICLRQIPKLHRKPLVALTMQEKLRLAFS